jgi:hypothetical protein
MAPKRRRKKTKTTSAAPSQPNSRPRALTSVKQPAAVKRSETGAPSPAVAHHQEPRTVRTPLYRSGAHEMPSLYHETYLRVLPRDPSLVFSYWEIAGDTLERIKNSFPGSTENASPPLLRLYEISAGSGRKQGEKAVGDIAIGKGTFSQYIRVPEPGHRYRIEYGITTQNGTFVPFCSSNPVDVPAARIHTAVAGTMFKADTGKLIEFSARSSVPAARPQNEITSDMTGLFAAAVGSSWGS